MASCTMPSFWSAPLPRPFLTAALASMRCTRRLSNENSSMSRAASMKMPVPQNSEPSAKPHSATSKSDRIERTWNNPMTVSEPLSVTPYAMDLPSWRWRAVHAMNFSKPSTVGGGGEINRVTSAQPSDASNAAASPRRSSRNVIIDPFSIGRPSRQSWRDAGAGVGIVRCATPRAANAAMLLPSCRRSPNDVVDIFGAPNDVVAVSSPDDVVFVRAPDDVVAVDRAPNDVVAVQRSCEDAFQNGGAPDDVVVRIRRAPDDVVAVGAPNDVVVLCRAPNDVVAVVRPRAPNDVVAVVGAPNDVVFVARARDDAGGIVLRPANRAAGAFTEDAERREAGAPNDVVGTRNAVAVIGPEHNVEPLH